jgi:hypothetical protein
MKAFGPFYPFHSFINLIFVYSLMDFLYCYVKITVMITKRNKENASSPVLAFERTVILD